MKIPNKLKNLFTETVERKTIAPRSARLNMELFQDDDNDGVVERRLKGWVRALFATAPWAAFGVILFAVFAQGSIAAAALAYGLVKVSIAVICAIVADATMFRGMKPTGVDVPWLPMMRRAVLFLGICWLMAVT